VQTARTGKKTTGHLAKKMWKTSRTWGLHCQGGDLNRPKEQLHTNIENISQICLKSSQFLQG